MKPSTRSPYVALLLALGCSAVPVHTQHAGLAHAAEVGGANITDLERELDETAPGHPGRETMRDAVTRYLAVRGTESALAGDSDAALRFLHDALVHYAPAEIGRGGLPDELAPLARAVLDSASPRGSEAHALAAARVLMALHAPDRGAGAEFQRILEWGAHNRQEFERPWVRAGELAEVYREAARIVPAPDLIERAAEQIVERRRAAMGAHAGSSDGQRLNFEELRQLQMGLRNAAADLAILYLRVGDVQEAANRITALGAGADSGLAAALGSIAQGEGGADSLGELAARLERIDPPASAGVCRIGRRTFPADARFAQCLALAAHGEHDYGLASAHLEAAATLSPHDQATLRAAIEATAEWLAHEVGTDDVSAGRRAYERVEALLERWRAAYPRQTPPVAVADLEETVAQLELAAGNLPGAQEHLTRATRAEPAARDAFYTLAEIAWRHGDGAAATRYLDAGLALPLRPDESDSLFRPRYAVRLALAARASHDEARARALFEQAGAALDALARSATGVDLALTHLARATVFDALGDTTHVRPALNAAVDAAPDSRDIAARAITFALSRGMWQDARDIDRVTRGQLILDRTWQVYFGLWGMLAARLGHLEDDGGAHTAVEAIATSAAPMSPWTVRLAQRYTGAIDRDGLFRYVKNTGQRAEALFYDGMLRLAGGDAAGAESDLHAVVGTEMLRFFEYDMAWEMLQRHVRPATTPGVVVPAATAARP